MHYLYVEAVVDFAPSSAELPLALSKGQRCLGEATPSEFERFVKETLRQAVLQIIDSANTFDSALCDKFIDIAQNNADCYESMALDTYKVQTALIGTVAKLIKWCSDVTVEITWPTSMTHEQVTQAFVQHPIFIDFTNS